MSSTGDKKSGKIRSEAEIRAERLAKTLRDTLQRRKQQARARRAGAADETVGLPGGSPGKLSDGLPATKKDESDA